MKNQSIFTALALSSLLLFTAARGPPLDATPDACQTCLISVRILEDILCDPESTEALVELVEKYVCPAVGDEEQCRTLAEGLIPTLIEWVRVSATPASLCSSAGVCGASLMDVPHLNKPALRVHDTAECAMCKYVVRQVKTAVDNAQTLERIKEVALQVCGTLPDELATSCKEFVEQYEPLIAELLETLDPDMVCGLAGVCMEALAAVPPPPLPAALVQIVAATKLMRHPPPPPLLAALAFLGLPPAHGPPQGAGMMGPGHGGMMGPRHGEAGPVDGPHQHGPGLMPMWMAGPGPMGNDACDYCKMAVIEAHSLVSNPTVQAEVVNYTKAVCDNFPSVALTCKSYVDMYAPMVFVLLEEYLVPDAVCVQTGMCPPPPKDGPPPHRDFMCWLADTWFGHLLGKLGLMPHHGHPEDAGVMRMHPEGRPEQKELLPAQ